MLPFNIASYALLAKILEKITGYKALGIQGDLKCVHFYDNQYKAISDLLNRDVEAHSNCWLDIQVPEHQWKFPVNDLINGLHPEDFVLKGYASDKAIKVEMLAPKKI